MNRFICFSLLSWSSVVLSTPLRSENGLAKRQGSGNWLVDDGTGKLVPEVGPTESPDTTHQPGDMIYESDGSSPSLGDSAWEGPLGDILGWMNTYHNTQKTVVVWGPPQKITEDVDCTGVASCSLTQTSAFTVTDSFSLNINVDLPINIQTSISNAIKATAKLGGSKMWTKSTTNTNSKTWVPEKGSKGHVVFFPYMIKACGPTYITGSSYDKNGKWYEEKVSGIYPNTCGYTPQTIANGQPDGKYSFCNIATGTGCHPTLG